MGRHETPPRWKAEKQSPTILAIGIEDQRLEWDSKNLRFTNNEKANALLHIKYRDGRTL